jgi:multidrug efflux pump subunit AcrA (membrane-fusion protein)
VSLAWIAAGCSKTETAQARGRDTAVKPVQVEEVRQETVRRAVEVVGTLAAVDQVTVSSEPRARSAGSSRTSAIA